MVTGAVPSSCLLEVACDESGSEGERLVGGNTDVFAHSSVHLGAEAAAWCIREIRARIGSPALEYKANHLLREKHRAVLTWLLGPSGPIFEHGRVYLADKAFFVVSRIVDVLVVGRDESWLAVPGTDQRNGSAAVTLYRDGERAFGRAQWQVFLESGNDLLRAKNRPGVLAPVESFFHMIDIMRSAGGSGRCAEVVELLGAAKERAASFRAGAVDGTAMPPAADPLVPAILCAVAFWGRHGQPISIIHDEQNVLSREVVARLQRMAGGSSACDHLVPGRGRLAALRLVDSRADPRVQLADFLAGVARKIASDALNHRADTELTELLRPYVDPASAWADERSWSQLLP
ncbi:hypothetical protein [Phytoactinopolyspora mesophila]|uniref:hypothetical protein n=1 Tax=Phytoactinopolyspora mesophila TaxID=2650750 RepID=UPI001C9E44B7|nr:hypothetical protein [Phytoactinopolyspora mesophila]